MENEKQVKLTAEPEGVIAPCNDDSDRKQESGISSDKILFKLPVIGPRLGTNRQKLQNKINLKRTPPENAKIPSSGEFDNDKATIENIKSSVQETPLEPTLDNNSLNKDSRFKETLPCSSEHLATSESVTKNKKSPAEQLQDRTLPLPYKEPQWAGVPDKKYNFEIIKNGTVISTVDLSKKSFYSFGRLTCCDVQLEHPSISRYHAVVQYRANDTDLCGFYLYDLDSTHGTTVNKEQVPGRMYTRLHVGHVVKFGGSSRLFILQGPPEDEEAESELSVTQLKEVRQRMEADMKSDFDANDSNDDADHTAEKQNKYKIEESTGIDWGMGEDAIEEDPNAENPFADLIDTSRREYKDPKKTLRGFFEREGLELNYEVTEKGPSHNKQFHCRIKLPIENHLGESIYAEATVTGKKKEAVLQGALEACRTLDAHGLLRQAQHESHKKKLKKKEEDDYYSSEDDEFLDRTGTIEAKRKQRIKRAGKEEKMVETYESLLGKLVKVESEMEEIEDRLQRAKQESLESGEGDSLDAFMLRIKRGVGLDHKERIKLKVQLMELRKEQARLSKMVNLAKPASLPQLKHQSKNLEKVEKKSSLQSEKIKGLTGTMKRAKQVSEIARPSSSPSEDSVQIATVTKNKAESKETEEADEKEVEEEEETEKTNSGKLDVSNKSDESKKIFEEPRRFQVKQRDARLVIKGPQLPPELLARLRNAEHVSKDEKEQLIVGTNLEQQSGMEDSKAEIATELETSKPQSETKKEVMAYAENDEEQKMKDAKNHNKELKRKQKQEAKVAKRQKKLQWESGGYDANDPNYAVWLPPSDQSGDGRTNLNEKFGY